MAKKIISIICTLIVILTAVPTLASENYEYEIIGEFKYIKGTNRILEYMGMSPICEFPENTVVEGIGENLRNNVTTVIINKNVDYSGILRMQSLKKIEELIFEEGVTEIIDNAVFEVKTLKKVSLPSTVEKIGYRSFYKCSSLEEINLPVGLKSIGEESFLGCKNLKHIEFPDGLELIGDGAFESSGLTGELKFPDTLKSIGHFSYCATFDRIYLPNNLEYWGGAKAKVINIPDSMLKNPPLIHYADEIIFNGDITLNIYKAVKDTAWCQEKYLKGKTDKSIGNYKDFIVIDNTIVKYVGNDKNVLIPNGITRIAQFAFRYSDIDTVTFSNTVEIIEDEAFLQTALKEVIIPQNIKSVGTQAFAECPMITKVVIEGCPDVGDDVFRDSGGLNEEFGIFDIKNPCFKAPDSFYSFRNVPYTPWHWYYNMGIATEIPDWMYELEYPPEKDYRKTQPTSDSKYDEESDSSSNKTDDKTAEQNNEQKPTDSQSITVWSENENIKISVDDKEVIFPDAMSFVDENSRTLSPIRAISEAAGFTVAWDGEEQKVTISKDGNIIILYIGSPLVSVNGKAVTMDTKAQIINGRTYIPVRFIGESLGYEVIWK